MIKFAQQLKRYRRQKKLSQSQLANRVHVTRQAVSKWEAGESSPDVRSLVKLANVFNVSLDELVLGHSSASTSKIDSSKFMYDPTRNKYVRNVRTMNLYEFLAYILIHYWWILAILLICLGNLF